MIRIDYLRKDGNIIELSIKGHANSGDYGKDLVCAAASGIVLGGLNALKNPKSFNIKVNDGDIKILALDNVLQSDYDVLNVILIQLLSIEKGNEKHIKIVEKGC